jgi:hypothetical protein
MAILRRLALLLFAVVSFALAIALVGTMILPAISWVATGDATRLPAWLFSWTPIGGAFR